MWAVDLITISEDGVGLSLNASILAIRRLDIQQFFTMVESSSLEEYPTSNYNNLRMSLRALKGGFSQRGTSHILSGIPLDSLGIGTRFSTLDFITIRPIPLPEQCRDARPPYLESYRVP
ncbi:hypothetical protein Tco_0442072 [Tanacetum coccineum]